ncbi:autotransporter outer membrane beta-barrel domain-containing protein [Bartonella sp. B35(2025)]
MIKVFKNHIYLCTFTTAVLSLFQNGIGICANVERNEPSSYGDSYVGLNHSKDGMNGNSNRSRRSYNISVVPISPSGPPLVFLPSPPPGFPPSPPPDASPEFHGYGGYGILPNLHHNGRGGSYNSLPGLEYDGINGRGYPNHNAFPKPNPNDESMKNYYGYIKYDNLGKDSNLEGGNSVSYGSYYVCSNCRNDTIRNKSFKIIDKNTNEASATAVAITVEGDGKKIGENGKMMTTVTGEKIIIKSGVSGKLYKHGISVSKGGKIVLKDFSLKDANVALYVSEGTIEVDKGVIESSNIGVRALGDSKKDVTHVVLNDTKITTSNEKASLHSYDGAEIKMTGGSVDFTKSSGAYAALNGKVIFDNVDITGKGGDENKPNYAAFLMDRGGIVHFSNGKVEVKNVHGILSENTIDTFNSILWNEKLSGNIGTTEVNLTSSSVIVNGKTSYGMYFRGEKPLEGIEDRENLIEEGRPSRIEVVNLTRTRFSVPDSTVVYSTDKTHSIITLLQSSLHSWDSLLKAKNGASVVILADASTLEGSTHVDKYSTAKFYLSNGSTWILQQKKRETPHESGSTDDLSVSFINLMNSSINFKKLKSEPAYDYQTLYIGKGSGEVYKALDDAQIYLNTYLDSGGLIGNQKTDRILIYGDVAGKTMVRVRAVSGSPGGYTGKGGNDQGISIIQVSGKANENSFMLDGGYVAMHGLPYQYKLYAYGPDSSLGEASSDQRLVKGEGVFWDFRLESKHIDSDLRPHPDPEKPKPYPEKPDPHPEPPPHPDPGVRDVVPQVPTYLLLPNALLHIGLMNIGNQSRRLEALRIAPDVMLKNNENPAFFIRSYGGNYRYISDLSILKYGYGGEIDYSAAEAGILLGKNESAYSITSFGVMGSYERLSLQPLDVQYSQKSPFNKWSITAYGGVQYNTGFYVDGLLSYGLFKGDVLTLARGKTATLKGKSLSTSVTVGEAFMTKYEGLVFDPQVQVVYQHLQFDKALDIDGVDIEMGRPDQWVMRTGGRLTKTLASSEEGRTVSFYGKLNLSNNLGGKQFVYFKDTFQLGSFGSSLEAGLGFNAQLSPKFVLYGDLIYQHKITKAGFSGTSFAGGLRYHF